MFPRWQTGKSVSSHANEQGRCALLSLCRWAPSSHQDQGRRPDPDADHVSAHRRPGTTTCIADLSVSLPVEALPRKQLECVTCRSGISVLVTPERCPMCGGAAWEPTLRGHALEADYVLTPR